MVFNDEEPWAVAGIDFAGSLTISSADLVIGRGTDSIASSVRDLVVDSVRGGNAPLTVTNSLTVHRGGFVGSPYDEVDARGGSTILADGATYDMTDDLNLQGDHLFRNEGSITWSAGSVNQHESSSIENAGGWQVPANGGDDLNPLGYDGTNRNKFVNTSAGTLVKTGDLDTYFDTPFENDGSFMVGVGVLHLEGSFASTDTDSGTWTIVGGATLQLLGNRHFNSAVDGAGSLVIGEFESVNGPVLTGGLSVASNMVFADGYIEADVDVTGSLVWKGYGAWFRGAHTTTIKPGATAVLVEPTNHDLLNGYVLRNEGTLTERDVEASGGTIENAGTFIIASPHDPIYSGNLVNERTGTIHDIGSGPSSYNVLEGDFTNDGTLIVDAGQMLVFGYTSETCDVHNLAAGTLSGGVWVIRGTVIFNETSTGIVTNAADVTIDGANASLYVNREYGDALADLTANEAGATLEVLGGKYESVGAPFTNAGTVRVSGAGTGPGAGTSALSVGSGGDYTQTDGLTEVDDQGLIQVLGPPTSAVVIDGGILTGTGTVAAGVVQNAARVTPGASPGILRVNGRYAQTDAGTLAVELDGPSPGAQYDRLAVDGSIDLGGTLELTTNYTPAATDQFTVVTGSARTGTFATVDGLGNYRMRYDPAGVTVLASPVPVLSIADASLVEGDSGTSNMVFTVTLDEPAEVAVSVHYATQDDTATAPADYLPAEGTATIGPMAAQTTIEVPIVGDMLYEPFSTFNVELDTPTAAVLGDATATGQIYNDDPLPSVRISDAAQLEGDAGSSTMAFELSLMSRPDGPSRLATRLRTERRSARPTSPPYPERSSSTRPRRPKPSS